MGNNILSKNKYVRNKHGFTLAELLVVVAIIAILVAVSIPIFSAQIGKAKQTTDDANLRAARGAAITAAIDGTYTSGQEAFYDISAGKLVNDFLELDATDKGKTDANKYNIIHVVFTDDIPEVTWDDVS